jgi:hypothetical protein
MVGPPETNKHEMFPDGERIPGSGVGDAAALAEEKARAQSTETNTTRRGIGPNLLRRRRRFARFLL